jgi:hypothetical protein
MTVNPSQPMNAVVQRFLITAWLLGLVDSRLPNGSKCGDHKSPAIAVHPYPVLYSIPGGTVSGPPLADAQADADLVYQLDSVGRTRDQAEELAGRMLNWVVGRARDGKFLVVTANPDGHIIHDRIAEGSIGAPLAEGTQPNEVYTVSQRFVISVTAV